MNSHAETPRAARRLALLAGVVTFALLAVLGLAAKARATETIYWDNYLSNSLAFADVTGSGGHELNVTGGTFKNPEGIAFDPVTGRLYVASNSTKKIAWANIDGSGGGYLEVPGMTVQDPRGIAIDPTSRTIYWANETAGGGIGWARLDGSATGLLNTDGTTIDEPRRPAVDTADNRIYWFNYGTGGFSWADLGGTGGSDVMLSGGAPEPEEPGGIDIDPAAGRLYWIDQASEKVQWVNLSGVGGGEVDTTGAQFVDPYGMAFDPTLGRFYWGNYNNGKGQPEAIGTATLAPGGGAGISPTEAPVNGLQDPVVLKSPTGVTPPQLSRSGTALSCTQGTWSQDYPGSFVWGAPTSYSYQWLLNGAAIPGATAPTLNVTAAGIYGCSVTAKNLIGTATQTASAGTTVTGATVSATLKAKKVQTKAGGTATVNLTIANAGQLPSAPLQVCPSKLSKRAKKGLVAPKCAALPALGAGASAVATLKVKSKKGAKGSYGFTALVTGAAVEPVGVNVKVLGAKKHRRKKH